MKTSLLILLLVIANLNTIAQGLYNHGDTIRGKLASYYCVELIPKLVVKVKNIQNKDTLSEMYYDNGEVVPLDRWLSSEYNFDFNEYYKAFKDIFTSKELQQLKNMDGTFITNVIADKAGNALEINFVFFKKISVLMNLDPDRLFQLETKLKKLLKLKIQGKDRNIKNVRYSVVLTFKKDL